MVENIAISVTGCCVIPAGRSVIVHMVKGAAINRRSGLGVVCCIKIEANEQLIRSFFLIVNFVAGGVTKKLVKCKGRVTFLNTLRRGRARIFYSAVDGDFSGPPPPKK